MLDSASLLRRHRYRLLDSLDGINSDLSVIERGRKRILFLTPHLSTGGMPQYLLRKIEVFSESADVYCILWDDIAPMFKVQKDQISKILGDRFFVLGENKKELITIIENVICPDIIHIDDICERFIKADILSTLYRPNRPYFICETPHSSTTEPEEKIFLPDKFIMVNKWIQDKYSVLKCPSEILEYFMDPVDSYVQEEFQEKLDMDTNRKHIINVGLFTPGKNQKEVIEYARSLLEYPIDFHFIGNLAGNFQDYWEPIIKELPKNCKIWGEREDVSNFYKAADLFLFTSNWELAPIVIRESIAHRLPILLKPLETYSGDYDESPYVDYLLPGNFKGPNISKIKKLLSL